jgi:hypothetical protein
VSCHKKPVLPAENAIYRQKNMDYSITEASNYNTASDEYELDLVVIYDIGCHWCRNFLERVKLNHLNFT